MGVMEAGDVEISASVEMSPLNAVHCMFNGETTKHLWSWMTSHARKGLNHCRNSAVDNLS